MVLLVVVDSSWTGLDSVREVFVCMFLMWRSRWRVNAGRMDTRLPEALLLPAMHTVRPWQSSITSVDLMRSVFRLSLNSFSMYGIGSQSMFVDYSCASLKIVRVCLLIWYCVGLRFLRSNCLLCTVCVFVRCMDGSMIFDVDRIRLSIAWQCQYVHQRMKVSNVKWHRIPELASSCV